MVFPSTRSRKKVEAMVMAAEKERESGREKGMDRVGDIPGNFYGKCLGSHNPG